MTFPIRVNVISDRSARTLLAWQCLTVMRCFMRHDLMRLQVTVRQVCGVLIFQNGNIMTSEERKEARYRRRQQKRRQSGLRYDACDNFEQVFSYEHLYHSYKECRKNVSWKSSVQKYISEAPLKMYKTYRELHAGTFRSPGFYEFDIQERGKKRHIKSVTIDERVVQRCLCDYSLVPLLSRSFIYDNGASLRGKGYHFTVKRLMTHLKKHIRKYGTEGYILLFDFSKFFDNVSHQIIEKILNHTFFDAKIKSLCLYFVSMFGEVGLGLGSQVSQILALASANRLDHFVKETLRIRGYGRYMDDGYLIHPSKQYLQICLEQIRKLCDILEIRLNERKTQIVKLSHGFSWMKMRIRILPSGKIIRKMRKDSPRRMRRKLKSYRHFVQSGILKRSDAYQALQSWRSYASSFNAYHTIQDMERKFHEVIIE